jgi:non-ribosomal peptide synthetase component F
LNANPLYNVALVMQNFPEIAFRNDAVEARFLPLDTEVAFLDLRFVVTETAEGIRLDCEYSSDLFEASTIDLLLRAYHDVAEQLTTRPLSENLGSMRLPQALVDLAEERTNWEERISVAATFTAEPIAEPLQFWLRQLRKRAKVEFASYNQVFQQLLEPESLLARNSDGVNVILLRLEDACMRRATMVASAVKQAGVYGISPSCEPYSSS